MALGVSVDNPALLAGFVEKPTGILGNTPKKKDINKLYTGFQQMGMCLKGHLVPKGLMRPSWPVSESVPLNRRPGCTDPVFRPLIGEFCAQRA